MRRPVPALDGLRGVAIALVLALHSGYGQHFLGGGLGVDLFFVLSGYLITTLLLAEWDRTGRIALGAFYIRRVLRLYPALVVTVLAAAIAYQTLPGGTWHDYWPSALGALFYIANFLAAFSTGNVMKGLGHTWTLALEEQFYLIWPLILILCLRAGRKNIAIAVTILGLAASWISLAFHAGPSLGGIPQAYFRPDSRAGGLLLGCLIALLLTHETWRRIAAHPLVGWVGAAGFAFTALVSGHGPVNYLRESIPAASVGAALLIAALVHRQRGILTTVLSWPPLRALGLISYGTYLYSGLINAATENDSAYWSASESALFRTGTALAAATISYFLIERPIRQRGRAWLDRRRDQALAATH